jgi:SAM-dependent methyltransferase
METVYDNAYFERQFADAGAIAWINRFLFQPYIHASDVVVDFGCGGGALLKSLDARGKIGVDVNPVARNTAQSLGLRVERDLAALPADTADVVISHHALEHTDLPLSILGEMRRVLKTGGRLVLVTPWERNGKWHEDNFDQHLHTWAPVNLGNLVRRAGFAVESSEVVWHRFPPKAQLLHRVLGEPLFHAASRIHAWLRPGLTQVRAVARKL